MLIKEWTHNYYALQITMDFNWFYFVLFCFIKLANKRRSIKKLYLLISKFLFINSANVTQSALLTASLKKIEYTQITIL